MEEASELINGQRQQDYGSPQVSFDRIAGMWSAYLGVPVTAHDVSLMMILLKTSRGREGVLKNGRPQHDSLVDIHGYAGCSEMLD